MARLLVRMVVVAAAAAAAAAALVGALEGAAAQPWDGTITLDATINFTVSHAVVGGKVRVQLSAAPPPGAGAGFWLGFGLSEMGSMPGSDIVTVHVVNGKPLAVDRFVPWVAAPLEQAPLPDPKPDDALCGKQDWTATAGSSSASAFQVTAERNLTTGDKNDRDFVPSAWNRVVWAWGVVSASSASAATPVTAYHGANRGYTTIKLGPLASASAASSATTASSGSSFVLPPDAANFTWLNLTGLPVSPTRQTQYVCQSFDIGTTNRQLVSIEPFITNKYVHHVIVHACGGSPTTPWSASYPNATACQRNDLSGEGLSPLGQGGCTSIFIGWAPGVESFALPTDAGFPLGGWGTRYIIVETHVNNPSYDAGKTFDVSFRLGLTLPNTRRLHDAGTMILGDPAVISGYNFYTRTNVPIPANRSMVHYEHTCNSLCTQQQMAGPVTMFMSFLHGHQSMRQIWAHHFDANGTDLGLIDKFEYWSFTHQINNAVNVTIKPGDRVNVHCVYDTSKRTTPTYFSQGSMDEMCQLFAFVYPLSNAVAYCGSATKDAALCSKTSLSSLISMALSPSYSQFIVPNPNPPDGNVVIPSQYSVGVNLTTCSGGSSRVAVASTSVVVGALLAIAAASTTTLALFSW